MAFDINTARPEKSGGFDPKTAKPYEEPESPGTWDKVKQAWGGNAEFSDAGNVHDWLNSLPVQKSIGMGFGVAGADMFGNEDDVVAKINKFDPSIKFHQDSNGNRMFTARDGKQYYINTPGADLSDALNFSGEAGTYLAGGLATAPIKNMGKRMAATAAVEGGVNVANQKVGAGRENLDMGEVAETAALGAAFEWAAPYLGKAFTFAKDKLTGSAKKIQKGKEIAGSIELTDDQLETLGSMRTMIDDSVPDEALIAQVEHGFKLTRGQATGDLAQLSKEQQLRQQPELMNRFNEVDKYNQGQAEQLLREQRAKTYGNVDDPLHPADSAQVAYDGLVGAEQSAKKAYKDAYADVGDRSLYVQRTATDGLENRLKQAVVSNGQRLSDRATPKAMEALQIISEGKAMMGPNTRGFSLKAFEDQRKQINSLFSSQMDGTDKRALSIIKGELDNWFYNSIDDSLLKGDPQALAQLEKARGLMHDYSKTFNTKEGVNKHITKILQEERSPEEFSKMLVGVNGLNKANAAKLVGAYKNAVGADSEAFQALRANVFEKMILGRGRAPDGGPNFKSYKQLVNTFFDAFNNKNKSLMKELFTNDEALDIKRLMSSMDKLTVNTKLANPSGSGTMIARLVAEYGNKIPILSKLWNTGRNAVRHHKINQLPLRAQSVDISRMMGATQAAKDER